ncbi:alpha-N-arabinofuranosidase [Microlunatus spumicola]|uniref:non-reducing end alpha-L-arabinofuranosidase n=1 Tax=Microlunatus spumicola TaxID=81499 RepID=A0ABP6WKS6_9ACTN
MHSSTDATVGVPLDGVPVRYSRDLFGHFVEHFHRQVYGGIYEPGSPLSDASGFRLDVVEAMRELRPSVVRWPGGCFVSSYHWLDGVGPDRRSHYDKAWRVSDPNTFGTAEFVAWCAAIGAAPYVCTNAGTGTAEEMSDWVEYCNLPEGGRWSDLRAQHGSPEPLAVPFWSIGNENYGAWEMGAKTPAEWAVLVREAAKMMRRVDESITLLTAARADLEWTLPLLEAAGPYVDMVSIHGYWDKLDQVDHPSDYRTAVGQSLGPQHDISRTVAILEAAGLGDRVTIAFDEWNLRGWHHPDGTSRRAIEARDRNDDNSTYTMADALFSASFLSSCLRAGDTVRMANIAPSVNTRGPLFVHPDGVVRRSTFHTLALFAGELGPLVLDATATSRTLDGTDVPVLDVLATVSEAGDEVQLVLVNRDPERTLECRVSLGGRLLEGDHPATLLTADGPDAYNDVDHPTSVVPRSVTTHFAEGGTALGPHSLTVVRVALPYAHPAGVVAVDAPAGSWTLSGGVWARRRTG